MFFYITTWPTAPMRFYRLGGVLVKTAYLLHVVCNLDWIARYWLLFDWFGFNSFWHI